ncbi:hypothetical protein KAH94_05485 [bacterium]|nr:hypothetical protein [bacterium]
MIIKKIVLATLFLTTIFSFYADDIVQISTQTTGDIILPCIDQKKVSIHRQKIEKMMQKHWAMRVAMPVALIGGCGFVAYWYLLRKSPEYKMIEKQKVTNFSDKELLHEQHLVLNEVRKRWNKKHPSYFSFQFIKNCVTKVVKYYAFGRVITLCTSLYKKFFHEDSLVWFIQKKTRCPYLCQEIKCCFAKISSVETLTDKEKHYYKETLQGISRSFVVHIEEVVAFMEYELAQFEKRGAILANDERLQIPHLTTITNNFVTSMQTLKKDSSLDDIKKSCNQALQFVVDLEQQIKRFGGIEHAIEWRLNHE